MDVTLQFAPEDQIELERRAAANGRDVAAYILDVVRQQLEAEENGELREPLPYDDWLQEFKSWVSRHHSRNPAFDDSRDSIYD